MYGFWLCGSKVVKMWLSVYSIRDMSGSKPVVRQGLPADPPHSKSYSAQTPMPIGPHSPNHHKAKDFVIQSSALTKHRAPHPGRSK